MSQAELSVNFFVALFALVDPIGNVPVFAAAGYEAAEANRPVCVTGAPNKAIAAFAKVIPDDWALALMAGQSGKFRKV